MLKALAHASYTALMPFYSIFTAYRRDTHIVHWVFRDETSTFMIPTDA